MDERIALLQSLHEDTSDQETILTYQSCAYHGDVIFHGNIYITEFHVWFYSKFVGFETSVIFKWCDIISITREKTAFIIQNAIAFHTREKTYFFSSISPRDRTFIIFHQLWLLSLKFDSITSEVFYANVNQIISNSSSISNLSPEDERALNGDDSERGSKDVDQKTNKMKVYKCDGEEPESSKISNNSYKSSSEKRKSDGNDLDEGKSSKKKSLKSIFKKRSKKSSDSKNSDVFADEQVSNASPSNSGNAPTQEGTGSFTKDPCECAILPINICTEILEYPIHALYLLLFQDESSVNLKFNSSRNFQNYESYIVSRQDENNYVKKVSYNITLQWVGKTILAETTQTFEISNSHITVNCVTSSTGMPYGNSFITRTHYCLKAIDSALSVLTISSGIEYQKSVWLVTRRILEKEVTYNVTDFITSLVKILKEELKVTNQRSLSLRDTHSSKRTSYVENDCSCTTFADANSKPSRSSISHSAKPTLDRKIVLAESKKIDTFLFKDELILFLRSNAIYILLFLAIIYSLFRLDTLVSSAIEYYKQSAKLSKLVIKKIESGINEQKLVELIQNVCKGEILS